jgi:colanic acid/amylovoran biosynthesis protein
MYRVYLTGQDNFGNRGCEALVRSTVALLKERFGDVEVFVPSHDEIRDSRQWPDHKNAGVIFVTAVKASLLYRVWGKLCNYFPVLLYLPWPPLTLPDNVKRHIDNADIVLSIGGDVYSLDYGILSLFKFIGVAEYAKKRGIPAVLWGVSVGPFERIPQLVPSVRRHLARLDLITVRESVSRRYLETLGVVENVEHVADSAFLMENEEVDLEEFWPQGEGSRVLGFNLSPLVRDLRDNSAEGTMENEVVNFLRLVVNEKNMSVLFIPHVAPLDGSAENNDEVYLKAILDVLGTMNGKVSIAPSMLNAKQIKYVIGKCDYFIGARTHATIAAISSGLPTLSISYSIKSKGINEDFLGTSKYILPVKDLSCDSLVDGLDTLIEDEQGIRQAWKSGMLTAKKAVEKGVLKLDTLLSRAASPE